MEYDTRSMAPIGLVCMDVPDDCSVALVDAEGARVDTVNTGAWVEALGGVAGGGHGGGG